MSNWQLLNRHRVTRDAGPYNSTEAYGFNGFFCLTLNGLPIKVIASDQGGWRHVSVSIHNSNSTPSWSVMCQVKDLFFEDEDCVMQLHPPKSKYVNQHPGCLHLWQPWKNGKAGEIPMPPIIMV